MGIDNAQGEYLYFIDSDDHIENDTFGSLIDADKKHSLDIVASEIIDENGTSAIRNAFAEVSDLYADTKDEIGRNAFFILFRLPVRPVKSTFPLIALKSRGFSTCPFASSIRYPGKSRRSLSTASEAEVPCISVLISKPAEAGSEAK